MKTVTIEIERLGEAANHKLKADNLYLAACDSEPKVNISIKCDQEEFEQRKSILRYKEKDPVALKESFTFLQDLVTKMFDDINALAIVGSKAEDDWLHLRLIVNPKELIQMPFELSMTPNGFKGQHTKPFLVNPQRLTTLTREVRQVGEAKYEWPAHPRILFAWANPEKEVPHEEHFSVLCDLAKQMVNPIPGNPEPVPDIGNMITIVKKASRETINKAIEEGINGNRPFTHVHLLAHGSKNAEPDIPEEFRLMLHDKTDPTKVDYVSGEQLALSVLEVDGASTKVPAIVSLMACDTANTGSIAMPAGSVAHQLHESGIPCVFASQFPLSVTGSVELVRKLYEKLLLEGEDPRSALYFTRKAISESMFHDWASLVAYIRFPSDIDKQMKDHKLKVLLEGLKVSNNWTEHALKFKNEIAADAFNNVFEGVSKRLKNSIDKLDKLVTSKGTSDLDLDLDRYAEHSGLMGSAYKRTAEHLFRLEGFHPEMAETLRKESMEAIAMARTWYYNGYKNHLKNHWTGMQYLSLAAVTKGTLSDEDDQDVWTHVKILAQADENADSVMARIWAWGTLAELYLLKPLKVASDNFEIEANGALAKAKEYMGRIREARTTFIDQKALKDDIEFAQQSTRRQIDRYISWWPQMIQSPGLSKLKQLAEQLENSLK